MVRIFYISTLFLFVACHQKQIAKTETLIPTIQPVTAAPEISNVQLIEEPILVNTIPNANLNETGSPYTIDSLTIKGDVLSVFVNYSGGCKTHGWELISNGMYAKSLPPQIGVCLKHSNDGDACRELIMKKLQFNITPLQYQGQNAVVVKLGNKTVKYTYNK